MFCESLEMVLLGFGVEGGLGVWSGYVETSLSWTFSSRGLGAIFVVNAIADGIRSCVREG